MQLRNDNDIVQAPSHAWRRRVGLRMVLTGLVVAAVLLTAIIVHWSWSRTARDNIVDIAGQLNREIVASVEHELDTLFTNANGVEEALRSILFQGAIAAEDEAKREYVFLSLLRSQPALSWVAFGFPNGNYFGAETLGDGRYSMVEVRGRPRRPSELRIDSYHAIPGDVMFERRILETTLYSATAQPWYRRAVQGEGTVWTLSEVLPTRSAAALHLSTRLDLYGKFAGVIDAVIELDRLSRFLSGLAIGKSGAAAILDEQGHILAASSGPRYLAAEMRPIQSVAGEQNAAMAAIGRAISEGKAMPAADQAEAVTIDADDLGGEWFVTLTPLTFAGWSTATAIPASDFLGPFQRNTQRLLLALIVFTLAAVTAAALIAETAVVRPLGRIAGDLAHVQAFRPERIRRRPSSIAELDELSDALVRMGAGLASFRKYLPAELVRTLVARGIEARPGGEQQVLSVLFTDLAGFTGLSERLGSAVVPILTDYLSRASSAIHAEGGTIDKFIGDAVMAFWGAPLPDPHHAVNACRAALRLREIVTELRAAAPEEARELSIRIGVNTGPMLVGNIGSEERLSYTVIGDSVNLASRLEGLNKLFGTQVIIGEATRAAAGDHIVTRELDQVAVYGRTGSTRVYELLALSDGAKNATPAWIAAYERGLALYRERLWTDAISALQKVAALKAEEDPPTALLVQRIRGYMSLPPPEDWNGIEVIGRK
ncbi:MAG TPA: adenylate/guanylate cyclase domain-containing protein [Alphaproteobacteria bacterium]|nr:adenylate/guanylate cyclase domain-containing protein [Alphaproteobacteria bacterium]